MSSVPNVRPAEAPESIEHTESRSHLDPARGIFYAVAIGTGVWVAVFAAAAWIRAIFFG